MPQTARVPINEKTLRWAREQSRVDRDDLAKHLHVQPHRIDEFETGKAQPTFRQLTRIAKKLDRPLGFFLAPPPEHSDLPEAADFRGGTYDDLPADLAREMRRAERYRKTMLELSGRPDQQLSFTHINWDNIPEQASNIRQQLGLSESFAPRYSQPQQVFTFWRNLLESWGFLVFQTTKISLSTFRGLSIYHKELPIILVNGADSPYGKVFTLFHELAHVANRTSGLCALQENSHEEIIANRFAANFLMPEASVQKLTEYIDAANPYEQAEQLAKDLKVSPLAAGVRLRTFNIISDADLAKIRGQSDKNWNQQRKSRKHNGSHVPHWRLRYRDLGTTYIGAVAQALEDQRVDMMDATYLLHAKIPTIEKMLDEYYGTGGTE